MTDFVRMERSTAENLILRVAAAEKEVERLRSALNRAHEQLDLFGYKGPKQVGRAMLTIERALSLDVSSEPSSSFVGDALKGTEEEPSS